MAYCAAAALALLVIEQNTFAEWTEISPKAPLVPCPRAFGAGTSFTRRTSAGSKEEQHALIFGGQNFESGCHDSTGAPVFLLDDVFVFAVATDRWSRLFVQGTTPSPRFAHTLETLDIGFDTYVVAFGGITSAVDQKGPTFGPGPFAVSQETWILGPLAHKQEIPTTAAIWSELPAISAPSPRYGHSSTVSGGRMYIFGGFRPNGSMKTPGTSPIELDEVWFLQAPAGASSPSELKWLLVKASAASGALPFPPPRAFSNIVPVVTQQKNETEVLLWGGWDGGAYNSITPAVWRLQNSISGLNNLSWSSVGNLDVPPGEVRAMSSVLPLLSSSNPEEMHTYMFGGTFYPALRMLGLTSDSEFPTADFRERYAEARTASLGESSVITQVVKSGNFTTDQIVSRLQAVVQARLGTVPEPRVGHTLVLVDTNAVLLFGGFNSFGNYYPVGTGWVGEIAYLRWNSSFTVNWRSAVPTQLLSPAEVNAATAVGTWLDGRETDLGYEFTMPAIWLIGGVRKLFDYSESLYMYLLPSFAYPKEQTGRWHKRELSPAGLLPRADHTAVLISWGIMLVYGGTHFNANGSSSVNFGDSLVAIDLRCLNCAVGGLVMPEVVWWNPRVPADPTAAEPQNRSAHVASAFGVGKMIVVGGTNWSCTSACNCSGVVFDDTWVWDDTNKIWSQLSPLPVPLWGASLAVFDSPSANGSMAYVFGGSTGLISEFSGSKCSVLAPKQFSSSLYALNLEASGGKWVVLEELTNRYRLFFMHGVSLPGKAVFYGGLRSHGDMEMSNAGPNLNLLRTNSTVILDPSPACHNCSRVWELNVTGIAPYTSSAAAVLVGAGFENSAQVPVRTPMLTLIGGGALGQDGQENNMNGILLGCNVGSASSNFSSLPCAPCDIGTFASTAGATNCTKCPLLTTTRHRGSTSISDCAICTDDACNNGGQCILANYGTASCVCDWFHEGTTCKTIRVAETASFYGGLAVLVIGVIWVLRVWRRRIRKATRRGDLYEMLIDEMGSEIRDLEMSWRIKPDELTVSKLVGEGSFGEVFEATYGSFNVAMKMIRAGATRDFSIETQTADFEREIKVLRQLRHNNVVLFFGAGIWIDGLPFFVTEFCRRGSLREILDDDRIEIELHRSLGFSTGIARGMAYLHNLEPMRLHRDLKAANILVSDNWTVKLTDFGSARLLEGRSATDIADDADNWVVLPRDVLEETETDSMSGWVVTEDQHNEQEKSTDDLMSHGDERHRRLSVMQATMSSDVGSLLWMSPEIIEAFGDGDKHARYGASADVYAFSIVMWEIMTRKLPYMEHEGSVWGLRELILSGTRPTLQETFSFPGYYLDAMAAAWDRDPEARPTSEDLVSSFNQHQHDQSPISFFAEG